jgi:hypothetical protein
MAIMIMPKRLVTILAVSALSMCAADFTGTWRGTAEVKRNGEFRTEPALVILKQQGVTLTGSGGPNEGEQHEMRNGKVDGNKITFEIPLNEERVMYFNLTAEGDRIEGDVSAKAKSGDGMETARLTLKRAKAD